MSKWTVNDMPNQTGKVVVVTGANSGIGLETVKAFVKKGAHVVMAARNMEKAQAAHDVVLQASGAGSAEIIQLDLASLKSIRRFADTFRQAHLKLDILVNNAGIGGVPLKRTADGFEQCIGINHLGHFALTGLLMSPLLAAEQARIVNVSSAYSNRGTLNFDDFNWEERKHDPMQAYADSKLANLLFTNELQRKLAAKGEKAMAVACHPGFSATNMPAEMARTAGSRLQRGMMKMMTAVLAQSAAKGALPTLMAAAAPNVQGRDYYGPGGFQEIRGYPTKVDANENANDEGAAAKLWQLSQKLTGVHYALLEEV